MDAGAVSAASSPAKLEEVGEGEAMAACCMGWSILVPGALSAREFPCKMLSDSRIRKHDLPFPK